MDIIQTFYDNMASQYDRLFANWQETTREQAELLHSLFGRFGFGKSDQVLDCACGIGTQAIGLAALGYRVTASDISIPELAQAGEREKENGVEVTFAHADFRCLSDTFGEQFPIVICMDNALPHMLTHSDLEAAVESIVNQVAPGGIFVASIRDYDALLLTKPPYSPPYIHKTEGGQWVSFQTWDWEGNHYKLTQYILDDRENLSVSKFRCEYRATPREEITALLTAAGCAEVKWLFPEETGFYQPIVVARK